MINKLGAAAAVLALLVTGACGGSGSSSKDSSSADASKSASSSASASASSSSGGRPTAAQVSATLQEGKTFGTQKVKLSKAKADCLSKVIVDSKLSDAAVTAFEKADNGFKGTAADTAELSRIQAKARACLS